MTEPSRLCPCWVQIPLVYNDGTEVEPETLVEVLGCFNRQFGGYTVTGRMEGSWHGQVEPSMRVEVAIKECEVGLFREVVEQIGARLKQEAMYFGAPPPSAEIIPIREYVKPKPENRSRLDNLGSEEGEVS